MKHCELCDKTEHVRKVFRPTIGLFFICEFCLPQIFNLGKFMLLDYPNGDLINYNAEEVSRWFYSK